MSSINSSQIPDRERLLNLNVEANYAKSLPNRQNPAFKNNLNKLVEEHLCSTPIDELGDTLINAAKAENSPIRQEYEAFKRIVELNESTITSLRSDLSAKNTGWHEARNGPDWATNSKGEKFDGMRSDIKSAMSNFCAAIMREMTGKEGTYKAFGTQGYRSDIDLTYLTNESQSNPDDEIKDFSFASSKLVFDAVFAKTFERLPEDLLDLEVYVQHPGISLHTGDKVQSDGLRSFVEGEIQATYMRAHAGEPSQELEGQVKNHLANDTQCQSRFEALIYDVSSTRDALAERKNIALEDFNTLHNGKNLAIEDLKKDNPLYLKLRFAQASFNDKFISDVYKNNIQEIQKRIDEILADNPFRSYSGSAFDLHLDAIEREGSLESQLLSPKTPLSSRLSFSSVDTSYLPRTISRFSPLSTSPRLQNRENDKKEDHLDLTPRTPSRSKLISSMKSGLPSPVKKTLHFEDQSNDQKELMAPRHSHKEVRSIGHSNDKGLSRFASGQGFNLNDDLTADQNKWLLAIAKLRVQQAQLATLTESLTKEGFNSQGALRDIVQNRDGQEDTKNALIIKGEITNLELQNLPVPLSVKELLRGEKVDEGFFQKLTEAKKSSSKPSLLSSAMENYHFFYNHISEFFKKSDDSEKRIDLMINESKYLLRFATRALDLYKDFNRAVESDDDPSFDNEIENLERVVQETADLEKIKREEQVPLKAFIEKIQTLVPLQNQKVLEDLHSLPPLKTIRLNDYFESQESSENIMLKSDNITNVGYYKQLIESLTEPNGIFDQDQLVIGQIHLPVLKPKATGVTNGIASSDLSELNAWAMALSGFDSGLYALPSLSPEEIDKMKGRSVDQIMDQFSDRGKKLKKEIFSQARTTVIQKSGLRDVNNQNDWLRNSAEIYGETVGNAIIKFNLLNSERSQELNLQHMLMQVT